METTTTKTLTCSVGECTAPVAIEIQAHDKTFLPVCPVHGYLCLIQGPCAFHVVSLVWYAAMVNALREDGYELNLSDAEVTDA